MMTPQMLKEGGIKRIVGSGACLIRNQVLQREIKELYKIPVNFVEEGNACIGAAMAIADRYIKSSSSNGRESNISYFSFTSLKVPHTVTGPYIFV